jgi:hypothetical protein
MVEAMSKNSDPKAVIEERRRRAQEIAAERSTAMEEGYLHLLGSGDPVRDDEEQAAISGTDGADVDGQD